MVFYKRNLPHYQPEGYAYFITTRLTGTIPRPIIEDMKKEYEKKLEFISGEQSNLKKKELYHDLQYNRFIKYEQILDSAKFGRKWLNNKKVASVVKEALHHRDGKEYKLMAYTIMPNHLHIIFLPINDVKRADCSLKNSTKEYERRTSSLYKVTKIMQSLKWFTAKEANKILNRKGKFWQHESYDHVIRDDKELRRLVEYLLNNPIKAGLTDDPYNYKWSYYNPEFII